MGELRHVFKSRGHGGADVWVEGRAGERDERLGWLLRYLKDSMWVVGGFFLV